MGSAPAEREPSLRSPGPVIFDCDGVLVDSEPVSNRVMAAAIEAAGLAIGAEEVARDFEGMRLEDIAAEVEGRLGKPLSDGWIAAFERRRVAEFRRRLEPIPGVGAVLDRIRAAGNPVCVAPPTRARRNRS